MSAPHEPTLPDRSGALVFPGSMFVASGIFAALLLYQAAERAAGTYEAPRYTSARNELLAGLVGWLSTTLGVWGSVALVVALVGGTGIWLGVTIRRYRRMVAADRAALGLS